MEYTNKSSQQCLFLPTLPHLCPYQCKCIVFAYIAVNELLKEQIKDVDAAQSKEVSVFWVGMAEVNTFNTFNIRLPSVQ